MFEEYPVPQVGVALTVEFTETLGMNKVSEWKVPKWPFLLADVVLLVFAAASWFGLWFQTPPYARIVALTAFGVALLAALFPLKSPST